MILKRLRKEESLFLNHQASKGKVVNSYAIDEKVQARGERVSYLIQM